MLGFGLILLLLHSVAVICFGVAVGIAMSYSAEYGMWWNLWYIITFPASLFSVPLEAMIVSRANDRFGFIGHAVSMTAIFFFLGGVQYYLIGCVVGRFVSLQK